jgi:cyclopropane fatty-acyl-phospholipid synthase-like methyltransferase
MPLEDDEQYHLPKFPRAAKYDFNWMLENTMGPNVLWLAEALAQAMDLQPGMRVLDMGCGKALSSIFLAQEYGVQVWATDLWISASDNLRRIQAARLQGKVFPLHAEAHALPYADGFFDAAVSLDAYHYFGTDDLYLGNYFARLVRPGGQIGIVVPGVTQELGSQLPEHLKAYWQWDFCSFHTPQWWQAHFTRTPGVMVERVDWLPDGWKDWMLWMEACARHGHASAMQEAEMLRLDGGRLLGFTRLVARYTPGF